VEKRADEVGIRPHLLAIHHFAPRVYDAPAILPHIHNRLRYTLWQVQTTRGFHF